MLLLPEDVALYFKLHRALMQFANQKLEVVPGIDSPDEFAHLPPETRLELRNAFLEHIDLIEAFVNQNPANLDDDELDIVRSWRHLVSGEFYAFRQLKKHMIFLAAGGSPVAYGVVALSEPLENLIGPSLPVLTRTVLMPFKGRIIYDGMLNSYNVTFGGGIKRSLNDSYREAKQHLGIVTSLPIEFAPTPEKSVSVSETRAAKQGKRPKAKSSGSPDVKPVLEAIISMTDGFCRQHLNDEYADLCRKLAEKLARKRPSPLLRGQPKTWACGILRTIGWVNFLDDRESQPHMKLTFIDKVLGVGESTGQGKSKEIRRMLRIQTFDMDWTLPSRVDDNLMGWMVEWNGFISDVREAPREIQEIAFKKGLIPYIPADRQNASVSDGDDDDSLPVSGQLYQFKIALKGSEPSIWRRIQVKDCTLDKLHEHIQAAMGWTNSHLYQFEVDGVPYGDPDVLSDGFADSNSQDSAVAKISGVVPKDGKRFAFSYQYDFGDCWEHEVLFEGCPQAEAGQQYPICVEGERACPPEDVGGMCGYGFGNVRVFSDDTCQQGNRKIIFCPTDFKQGLFLGLSTHMLQSGKERVSL